jgi:hypothetical protein
MEFAIEDKLKFFGMVVVLSISRTIRSCSDVEQAEVKIKTHTN